MVTLFLGCWKGQGPHRCEAVESIFYLFCPQVHQALGGAWRAVWMCPARQKQTVSALSCVLQLFDCKPITAVWWDCSWSLLVCVAMNPPKEGPLKALGDSTLTLDWAWEAGFTQAAFAPFISSVKILQAIWGFTEDSTFIIHFFAPFPTHLPHASATLTIFDSITSFFT